MKAGRVIAARAGLLAALLAFGAAAHARLIETQLDVPVTVEDMYRKSISQSIRVTVFVDDRTPAPRPVMIINHGRAVTAQERAALGRARFSEAARHFANLGFMVAVPTRIGYGVSGGEDAEDTGSCDRKVYPPRYKVAADQTRAVLEKMTARDDARKDRSVVLGQSFGGTTAVTVAALNWPGVVAAVNFAGGGGGNPQTHPGEPCAPRALERMFRDYGRTAKVPMLWIYTENDQFMGARYPREWFKAYRESGAPAEMTQFPPHGEDGHGLFTRFPAVWQPVVDEFLRRQGFELKALP